MNTLTQNEAAVNILTEPTLIILRVYDEKGEWHLEAAFEGGAKVTGVCDAEFVNDLESDLTDQGWQVDPSLFHRGFNAKPPIVDDWGMMFASSAGLWPDDLGLAEVTL